MQEQTLESMSLWHSYKSDVWLQDTEQQVTVHNIMRTIRAFRNYAQLAYVSVPITSGRYLYAQQLRHPLARKEVLLQRAIRHNYWEGLRFVEELSTRRTCPILYPADLEIAHQHWEQTHFQALWLSIIAEKCTELHMTEGWEFSNGGCEELTHVFQLRLGVPVHSALIFYNTKEDEEEARRRMRNIRVYDHKGTELVPTDALASMESSLGWIAENGFSAPKIERCRSALYATHELLKQGFYQ